MKGERMNKTGIEYVDFSWNPVAGCSHYSPGCDNCYAEKMAMRLREMEFKEFENQSKKAINRVNPYHIVTNSKGWNGEVAPLPDRLNEPLKVKKPSRIFVCSMSDLFHPWVPAEYISRVLGIIAQAHWHTFMILTKRAERMMEVMNETDKYSCLIPNLWLGVTVCNPNELYKLDELRKIPAVLRFVSFEPLLEDVGDISHYFSGGLESWSEGHPESPDSKWPGGYSRKFPGVDWVICGCESGANRRPANIEWIRSLRNQCVAAGTPFFLKQMEVNGKLVAMPELDGRVWNQMPTNRTR